MAAATETKVLPAVIVGSGRVGRALLDMGNGEDFLVKRGESVPLDFPGPILVCTRNDDLEAVLESTPRSRWNGMIIESCYCLYFLSYLNRDAFYCRRYASLPSRFMGFEFEVLAL